MTIIVNGTKAYINPSVVDTAGGKLTVNGEVVKAKLTDNEQDDVDACLRIWRRGVCHHG